MKIKCEYCGNYISDTDEKCPNCGATNLHLARGAAGVPKTIDELKAFCASKNLPLDRMRFFIGENYTKPRAFGVFRDENGDFVVYKNKSDGSRTIRYQGKDEAYAVNELYQKMRAEIVQRKKPGETPKPKRKWKVGCLTALIVTAIFFVACALLVNSPSRGYYLYNDTYYYYQDSDWYVYEDGAWTDVPAVDDALSDNGNDYWQSGYYNDDYGASDFSDSEYYQATDSSDWDNDDWDDDDWDVDSGGWDSGGTDWHSDW